MPSNVIKGDRVPIRVWAPVHEIESEALRQLKGVASLPWVAHHVAVMPDVHVGKGATVGSVIALRGAVAPAAVGVDIGCGMAAMRTNLTAEDLPDDLKRLRSKIEDAIPVGPNAHAAPVWESAGAGIAARGKALMDRGEGVPAGMLEDARTALDRMLALKAGASAAETAALAKD